ncbi:hypothetical protein GCM10010140_10610 [Streptosporangium pseudovulgare]|uniref:Cell wall-active antibiotics response LiaF-like C-terminal domain-containing protein n=2 Tax=Streptosporangium pseudovulgare TaxID=35765 RepID=A0ABQ2QIJ3_9ACTN|nr:hypothetical protein GCM10010140_10610 [Streptosporangium pseudovulgare]
MRVSDAEREAAVELLRVASVEGRLTLGELTERTEAAYTAVTHADLAALTSDLPPAQGPGPAHAHAPAPVRPEGGRARRWLVAVMSESKRRGKWRIDRELGAAAVMGEVTIDLRQAEVRTDVVDIFATAVMGSVKIIVPDGVDVEIDGFVFMGEKKVQVIEAPEGMRAPLVRVRAYALMGEIKVVGDSRARPIEKAWAAWKEHWQRAYGELPERPRLPLPPHGWDPRREERWERRERRAQEREERRDRGY